MKKKLLKVISIILVVMLGLICISVLQNNSSIEQRILKQGKEILKNTYPDVYDAIEKDIVVEKRNDTWRVYNKFEPIEYLEDGSMIVSFGGIHYVDFDAVTGEVVEVAVED